MDYIFIRHSRDMKIYKMLGMRLRGSDFINRICIPFNEYLQGKINKDRGMKLLETMTEKSKFELEVHTIYTTNSSEISIKKAFDHLIRDNAICKIESSQRGGCADLGCYDLNVADG